MYHGSRPHDDMWAKRAHGLCDPEENSTLRAFEFVPKRLSDLEASDNSWSAYWLSLYEAFLKMIEH